MVLTSYRFANSAQLGPLPPQKTKIKNLAGGAGRTGAGVGLRGRPRQRPLSVWLSAEVSHITPPTEAALQSTSVAVPAAFLG